MKDLKSIRMEKELIAAIQAKAKEDNRTFTNMVTTILEDWRKKETKAA